MKKYLAGLAATLMLLAVMPASAQYGQYDSPGQSNQQPPYPPDNNEQYGQQPNQPQPGDQQNAQQGGQQGDQSDQNQPGMARLSYIQGDVSSQRGDNGDWVAATVNTPISPDDRVSTGQKARAEIQLDFANVLRMSGGATAKIAAISRSAIQVQIGQGLVTYSVLKGSEATPEIDTPNASIHPNGPGEYRVLVNSDAETQVIIRQGSADISTPQGSAHIDQGQMITIAGTDNPQYKTETAFAKDDWDSWNADRDRRIETAQSWQNTDRYYTGSEDLDTYGTWSEVPDYGQVWIPQQAPGWAPYRSGRWVYTPYYGWTWTSYEPWGWAPYHYGRWFVYGNSWAWWPGPVGIYPAYYPVWSPAYVSFFGFGGGFGFGIGFGFGFGYGNVGWLPCGPGDWYHPWYGRWGGHYNSVTINNYNNFHQGYTPLGGNRGHQYSNINGALNNDRIRGGVSSMRGDQFGRGAVSGHQESMSAASFRQASLISGKMPITPSRESYSPSGREANPSSYKNAPSSSQHFFSGGTGGNSAVNSTSSRSSSFGTNGGSTSFSGHSAEAMNSNHSNSSAATQSNRSGWRTFTPPQSGSASQGLAENNRGTVNNNARVYEAPSRQSSAGTENQSSNSWEHFTPPASASRGTSSNSYSRSPLDMRQPIVTRRGESSGSGSYYGGTRGGSYNTSRPTYSAPQPGYSAPRPTYSAPRPTYNAPRPTYSAPRSSGSYGGGGRSSGGGGGHSGGHR